MAESTDRTTTPPPSDAQSLPKIRDSPLQKRVSYINQFADNHPHNNPETEPFPAFVDTPFPATQVVEASQSQQEQQPRQPSSSPKVPATNPEVVPEPVSVQQPESNQPEPVIKEGFVKKVLKKIKNSCNCF